MTHSSLKAEVMRMTSDEKKKRQADAEELNSDSCEEASDTEDAGGAFDGSAEPEEPTQDEAAAADPEQEELQTRYMRLMADFQNFKRRTEKEKSDIYAFANEKIVRELLDVTDNFERALAIGNGEDGEKFLEGMEMILKQLLAVLERAGAAEIKALGEDFDPNFHNAVMTEDSTEYESGKVTAVLQKGYTLNGRVVRPTMVKVSN